MTPMASGGFGGGAVGAARLEVGLVVLDGAAGLDGGEEVGEGVGQALLGRGDRGPHGRAEQPEVGGAGGVGGDADAGEGVVGAEEVGEALGVEEGAKLGELLGEVVGDGTFAVAAEGEGFELASAGSPADAEVDAVGKHGVEGAKDLGDLERGVVREHDAAGAYADVGGLGGGAGDEDLGRGAGEEIHGMVFGVPEAGIAEGVDVAGEVEGIGEGLRGRRAGEDGRLVEYREAKWGLAGG